MSGPNNITKRRRACFCALLVITTMIFVSAAIPALFAQQVPQAQTAFQSPEAAMKALVRAIEANDTQKMLDILGPEGQSVISSGDEVSDRNHREKFVKGYRERVDFVKDKDRVSVILGKNNWPMAIPIVKNDAGWVFDTQSGLQELLNRRIGRNELSVVETCLGYVDAQREYASIDRNLDGIMQYAQSFCSSPGKRDGLFWEVAEGEEPSPLGPAFVAASEEGYKNREVCSVYPAAYHGYHYKILTAQGAAAPGGAYNYVINGNMVAGFALIAWPAEYAVSGVMTFIVNQNGIVYEKDLGPTTEEIAKEINEYNPDSSWSRAQ